MNIDGINGEMTIENGVGTVAVSSVYDTTIERLWQAVTSVEQLRQWFGDVTPRGGDATSFDASLTTGWAGTITVIECVAPTHLTAELRDDEDSTTVTAELEPADGGTRLTLAEHELGPSGLHNYVAAWHAQLDQLRATLNGQSEVPLRPRWEHLRDQYAQAEPRGQ